MPRHEGREQEIDGGEEAESSVKTSIGVDRARLETNIVHGGHYGLAFRRWRNKFQKADGVAGGEEQQQNCGDAVEPSGFHLLGFLPHSAKICLAVNLSTSICTGRYMGVKNFCLVLMTWKWHDRISGTECYLIAR